MGDRIREGALPLLATIFVEIVEDSVRVFGIERNVDTVKGLLAAGIGKDVPSDKKAKALYDDLLPMVLAELGMDR